MFKSICLAAAALSILVTAATAEITFIRPGEKPLEQPRAGFAGTLDLDAVYRGIELTSRIRTRLPRAAIVAQMMNDFGQDDLDGLPGIGDADRTLAAQVEIAAARANAARAWATDDLDGDGVVTRDELLVVGRTQVAALAQRQKLGGAVELTEAQREQLALEYVARGLARDRDGDDRVSYDEATAGVDAERILTRIRTEGGTVKPVWDVDGDGTIAEAEMRQSLDRLLGLIDANGDGVIEVEEARAAQKDLMAARARAQDPSRGKRIACTLPEVPEAAEVVVLQGEAGTAVTNLAFGEPNDRVVRMTEVVVPEGEGAIFLIVSMRTPTLVRLLGPGAGRVEAVVGVAATVAVAGGEARLANTPCHRGFLGIRIVEPGGVAQEFNTALGRDDVRALVAERLGRVELGGLTNDPGARLEDDALPVMKGDGQVIVDRFLSFDPGGYQQPPLDRVQSTVPVRRSEVPPLEIGLIVLASEGKIGFVAPEPEVLTREGGAGEGANRQEAPRRTAAGFPLTVVVRRAIDLPAGLTTERGVRLIVPDGVPPPRGAHPAR